MADDMPSLDQMGNPTGEPVDVATPQKVGNDTAKGGNFFSQFLTGDETKYQDMSFGQRVTDTAKANWYTGTGLGTSIARMQADPAAATERALDGLTEEEKQSARATFADWQASELAKLKTAENPVNVTDAQIAVIQNKLHPSASGAGDVAADVIGALGGGLASPEMLVLPSSGAAKGLAAAAPVTARFLEGMAGRMLDTGVSMAVLNTGMNPVIQKQSVEAGLQPEFDYMRLGLAPLEGFIGGALLHGAMEGAGRGIGYATSEIRRGFQQQIWSHITDPLKEDAAFRVPGERAPMVEPDKVGTVGEAKPNSVSDQPNSVSGADNAGASPTLGTVEPQGRLASQPSLGLQSVTARMSADTIKADLGVDVPGTLVRGAFGVPKQEGITAFHGSPHDFEKFSLDKIGTGEGAQAYGHGLYFAQNEGVARGYQKTLSENYHLVDGKPVDPTNPEHIAASYLQQYGSREAALAQVDKDTSWAAQNSRFAPPADQMSALEKSRAILESGKELPKVEQNTGFLYQVQIKAHPDHFLDWDKPLSEQSAYVRERLAKFGIPETENWPKLSNRIGEEAGDVAKPIDGAEAYSRVAQSFAKAIDENAETPGVPRGWGTVQNTFNDKVVDHAKATEAMRAAGIEGIRYADAGSRGKGEGTSNFVVFDDSKIHTVAKNGKVTGLNETLRGEAQAKFADELKAAGVKPEAFDADILARAEAKGGNDLPAAIEQSALERAYEAPETRDLTRKTYGKFKVQEAKVEKMPSLIEALAKEGLKPDPELKTIFGGENPFIPGSGRLIRKKGGMSLDDALTVALEGRYLRDGGFHGDGERTLAVNDLLEAIRQDHAALGNRKADDKRVYPEGYSAADRRIEAEGNRNQAEMEAAEKHIRDEVKISEDHEPPPEEVWRDAAAHMVFGGEKDAHRAFDRAVLDYERTQGEHEALIRATHGNGEADRGAIRARAGYDEEGRVVRSSEDVRGAGETGGAPGTERTADGKLKADRYPVGLDPENPSSWIIRDKETGKSVMKTFDKSVADKVNTDKYEVVPALQHLQEYNAAVKASGGHEPPPGWNKKALATEPGAEGKAQTLIPGVEPVTDKQRAELAASKPLKGGDVPAGGLFDDNARAQTEIAFRKRTGQSPEQPATAGTGEPPVDQIKSLQQQTFALAEALGVPMRQGRLAAGDALGQYNSKYGVARVRDVGDFFVAAHEGGHALEQKIGPGMSALIDKYKGELGPLDYDGQGRASEGFAEWFAMSLTNPAKAQKEAPNFAQEFRAYLGGKEPDTLAKLDEAAQAYANYLNAPSGLRVASNVVQKGEMGWYGETKEFLKKEGFPATIGKVLADGYGAFFDDKAPVARSVRNLARLFRDNHGGELIDLKAADNPETLLRLFGRAQQGAIYQMRYGVVPYRDVTPVGASLHDAIATATGASPILGRWRGAAVDDFSTYMVAKRASVLWDRFTAGDLEHPPVAFSKADAEATITALAQANPGFEKGAAMVHEYTRNMLAKQRDAGLITQDLFDTLAKDPFYVPLFRDVEDKPLSGKMGGGGSSDGPGMTDTIKRLRGSSRDIIDPIQGIMMQTFLAERTIRHNDIIKAFADLADRVGPGAGAYVEPVPAKELRGSAFDLGEAIRSTARQRGLDPNDTALLMNSVTNAFGDDPIMGTMFKMQPASKKGEPIMFYKEAGEMKAVRFMAGKEGEAVYETLSSLPNALKDLTLQVMQGAASTLRFGVTANPVFIVTNFIRDQMALGILRPDYLPFISGLRGLKAEVTQDKAAQLYAYFGGVSPGASVTDTRGMMDANVGSIAVKGYSSARMNLSSPKEFVHGIVEGMQITEAASRNSVFAKVYEQKTAQGLSPYEAAIEAAYQGTDILDFGRHGSRTMALRQLVPFLNAHLQGLDLGRRTILEPLARAARGEVLTTKEQAQVKNAYLSLFKMSAVGSALGFAYAALAWDREEYRDANNDMKATHLIVPWGHKVLTIPKPFELGLGFNAGEAAYAAMMGKDPRAASNFTEGAWEVLKPPNPITGNPLIKTVFEVALNRNMFTGRDIVPQSLQAIDPQHQFTERTSMFAKKVGDVTKSISDFLKEHTNPEAAKIMGFSDAWSPIKVDYAIGSLFGMWGKDIQAASNWFAGDDDKPESQFEDMVFLRRFLKDPNRSGEMTKRYFEFAAQKTGQYAQAVNTYDRYTNMYQDQKAKDWLATLPEDRKAFVTLNAGADDETGKRTFSADDRRVHPVTRAQAAMSQLNSMTRELTFNSQINSENGERYNLTPTQRRDAIEALHQLGAQEMRNALVMVGDKGYEGRPVLDTGKQFEIIKAISPEVGEEVARRYATGKVLPAASVAEVWPQMRKRLLQDGSEADISDLTSDASAAGYEFGGERTKRRERRRGPIKGMSQQATDGD